MLGYLWLITFPCPIQHNFPANLGEVDTDHGEQKFAVSDGGVFVAKFRVTRSEMFVSYQNSW